MLPILSRRMRTYALCTHLHLLPIALLEVGCIFLAERCGGSFPLCSRASALALISAGGGRDNRLSVWCSFCSTNIPAPNNHAYVTLKPNTQFIRFHLPAQTHTHAPIHSGKVACGGVWCAKQQMPILSLLHHFVVLPSFGS